MIIPRFLGALLALGGPLFAELKKSQSGPCSWDTSLPPWATNGQTVAGNPFCSEYWREGDTITGLTTYSTALFEIIGVDIAFASGRKIAHYGSPYKENRYINMDDEHPVLIKPSGNITLGPGEFITAVKLYPRFPVLGASYSNDKVRSLTAITIATTSGRTVNFGHENAIVPGKGYLVSQEGPRPLLGVSGSHDDKGIGMLRFHFHKSKITDMKVSKFNFGFDNNGQLAGPRLDLQDVGSATFVYEGPIGSPNLKHEVNKQETYKVTNSVSEQHESKLGVGISISFELSTPEVPAIPKMTAKYGLELTWEKKEQTTYSREWSREVGKSWKTTVELLPNTAVRCVASIYNGTGRFPYTAETAVTFEDKTTHRWNQTGVYNTVSYSDAFLPCTVIPIEEAKKRGDYITLSPTSNSTTLRPGSRQ